MNVVYKEKDIYFDQDSGVWYYLERGDRLYQNTDVNKVKAWIDKYLKKGFKRIDVIVKNCYYGDAYEAQVTSLTTGNRCWVVNKRTKERSKVSRSDCVAITDVNKKLIAEIADKGAQAEKINEQAEELEEKLEKKSVLPEDDL